MNGQREKIVDKGLAWLVGRCANVLVEHNCYLRRFAVSVRY